MLMGMKGAYLGHTYNSQLGKVQFHPSTGPTRPNQTHYMEGGTEAKVGLHVLPWLLDPAEGGEQRGTKDK